MLEWEKDEINEKEAGIGKQYVCVCLLEQFT